MPTPMTHLTAAIAGDGRAAPPPAPVALRDALRLATAEVHERLHHHPGFAAVQAGTIDRAAYTALLGRLYGFYRPFEATARITPERTRWLEIDLAALGVAASSREALPRCDAFRPRAGRNHLLGARYVVEGSALGGRAMARQLDLLLGAAAADGRRFFSGHGAATGAVWRDYLALLAIVPRPEQTRAVIVNSASATFAIFERWLAGWGKN